MSLCVSVAAAIKRIAWTDSLNRKIKFSVSGGGRSEMRVPFWVGSGESPCPGFFKWQKAEEASSLMSHNKRTKLYPQDLIPSQTPQLQTSPNWGLGFQCMNLVHKRSVHGSLPSLIHVK